MTSFIPDTLQGALILSLIDFFLSFVVISFIGLVLSGFPLLNRFEAWASRVGTTAGAGAAEKSSTQPAPTKDRDTPIEDVVAISAAIAAVVGKHRILSIEPQRSHAPWSVGGRLAHHNSHVKK